LTATRERRSCALRVASRGDAELCTLDECPFWEPGGAIADGGCVVERLGIDLGQPSFAAYLLEVREHLEEVRDRRNGDEWHSWLARRIGLEL
jgi:hypothetical protein